MRCHEVDSLHDSTTLLLAAASLFPISPLRMILFTARRGPPLCFWPPAQSPFLVPPLRCSF